MGKYLSADGLSHVIGKIKAALDSKADKADIKTVNNVSLLGSGNVAVQPTLVSGTNIKTVNGNSLLGSGDVVVSGEANQNAFSNVQVGSSTIAADSKTDTLTLAAGSNVTLTADTSGDKVTIAATDTTYGDFAGAIEYEDGYGGLVPIPEAGQQNHVLSAFGDGGWKPIADIIANAADGNDGTGGDSLADGFVVMRNWDGGNHVQVQDIQDTDVPSLPASKIGSGTFDTARIPSLPASKIGSGTLGTSYGGTGQSSLANARAYLGNPPVATCATTNGTAAKVVSLGGFSLYNGARILVRFSYAQTSAVALTLNVNSTGAKTVYVNGASASTSNALKWRAYATLEFAYYSDKWIFTGLAYDDYSSGYYMGTMPTFHFPSLAESTKPSESNMPVLPCRVLLGDGSEWLYS